MSPSAVPNLAGYMQLENHRPNRSIEWYFKNPPSHPRCCRVAPTFSPACGRKHDRPDTYRCLPPADRRRPSDQTSYRRPGYVLTDWSANGLKSGWAASTSTIFGGRADVDRLSHGTSVGAFPQPVWLQVADHQEYFRANDILERSGRRVAKRHREVLDPSGSNPSRLFRASRLHGGDGSDFGHALFL